MSYSEAILQICLDHSVSCSAWASRPNSIAASSSMGATQPDVFTGTNSAGNPDFQLTNPSSALNENHKTQPMELYSANGGGANWAYLWNRFVLNPQ